MVSDMCAAQIQLMCHRMIDMNMLNTIRKLRVSPLSHETRNYVDIDLSTARSYSERPEYRPNVRFAADK